MILRENIEMSEEVFEEHFMNEGIILRGYSVVASFFHALGESQAYNYVSEIRVQRRARATLWTRTLIVGELLRAGADVDARDYTGKSVRELAIERREGVGNAIVNIILTCPEVSDPSYRDIAWQTFEREMERLMKSSQSSCALM